MPGRPPSLEHPPGPRTVGPSLLLLALLPMLGASGCVDSSRTSGVRGRSSTEILFEGTLGPEGGDLVDVRSNALHPGLRLSVPAGALERPTTIRASVRYGDPAFPSAVQVFELTPAELHFALPAQLTIEYSDAYDRALGAIWGSSQLEVWSTTGRPEIDSSSLRTVVRDPERRLLTAETVRLGRFYAMHTPLRTLIHQPAQLVDPAEPVTASLLDGVLVADPAGALAVRVGQGSLQSFFANGSAQNLLVLHGTLGSAVVLGTPASYAASSPEAAFNREFTNVVAFEYPSARSLAESGNRLYDALSRRAGPNFGCRVLAHGVGGLVLRHALERSHVDTSRAGYRSDDPPLSTWIDRAVFVGTPNRGTDLRSSIFAPVLEAALPSDAPFLQGLLDLTPGSGTFLENLNADLTEPPIPYFAIAGDVGSAGSDGVVDVDSVLDTEQLTTLSFDRSQVFAGPLYDHLGLIAFAARTGVVPQARTWLQDVPPNARPVIGSLGQPVPADPGRIDVPFRLSDADSDPCLVIGQFAVDGGPFRPASAVDVGAAPQLLRGAPAPGSEQVFRWDAARDLAGRIEPARVTFRILAADQVGPGFPGQTGTFVVQEF